METGEERLEKGREYQDFLSQVLLQYGIVLTNFSSASYQDKGENVQGWEIKLDTNFQKTGNLYFETHGTWNEYGPNPNWVERGILKNDNTWLYFIGDFDKLFIISKKQLIAIYNHLEKYYEFGVKVVSTNRSKGFVCPISFLRKKNLILKEFDFYEI